LKTNGVPVISHVGEQIVQGLKDHVAVEDWNFLFLYIFMHGGLLPPRLLFVPSLFVYENPDEIAKLIEWIGYPKCL
jgi:hypothetical protein